MPEIRLIIFDLDDTLVRSGMTWRRAEIRLFDTLGAEFSEELARQYKGMNVRQVGERINTLTLSTRLSAEESGQLLRSALITEFRRQPPEPMPGAEHAVALLAERYLLALASGSPLEAIQFVLERYGWTDRFSPVVSSEEVLHGKPAPDVFLLTSRRANVPPGSVLVIEDSLHGVRAAKAAGMYCLAVPSSDNPHIGREADRVLPSLEDITPGEIDAFYGI